jgi:hypothetical protein
MAGSGTAASLQVATLPVALSIFLFKMNRDLHHQFFILIFKRMG